jgi:ribose transport system permease protein
MNKVVGIFGLLVVVFLVTALMEPNFLSAYNLQNIARRSSLYGIIGIGVALVIITGGIDLSIGSVIGLVGCLLPIALVRWGWSIPAALLFVFIVCLAIGLFHGVLIAKLRLQPFVVTLCGLLIYRGIGRWLAKDETVGFGRDFVALKQIAVGGVPVPLTGGFEIPNPTIILIILAVAAAVFLNRTVYGRYLFALGNNEQAARYSGINTDRMIILAYVLCTLIAGLGAVLFALDVNSIQPAGHGNFYELYAIAAAVLGGCSLRGGEGTILGVVIGAAVIRVLYNSINLLGMPTELEFAIIGIVILIGVAVDEVIKRIAASRRRGKVRGEGVMG